MNVERGAFEQSSALAAQGLLALPQRLARDAFRVAVPALGDRLTQLGGMDAAFVFLEGRETPMHLTTMYIYDQSTVEGGVLRHKDILRLISSRLSSSPVFQQRLVHVPFDLDRPYWVKDENIDLEFHVRHVALPKPADWRQLCVLAARLHARPLDMDRPPWEINIIEGLDHVEGIPAGSFAALVKYHHAAVDGATGNDILGGLTDTHPHPDPVPELVPYDRASGVAGPGNVELLTRAAANNAMIPLQLARKAKGVVPGLTQLVLRALDGGGTGLGPAPSTRFNRMVSPHRVVQGVELDLADVKAVKDAVHGATVNDVVIAVCGGALRQYLQGKDELPQESLVAMVPISTRLPGEPPPRGNSVTAMLASLQTVVEDPLERLRAVHESTVEAKATTEAIGARQLSELSSQIPAAPMSLACRVITASNLGARAPAMGNCVVTNVPGPQIPLYLSGAKLVASYGFGPLVDGVGLLILATSYDGRLFLSVTSCRDIVDDPQFLAQCLHDSFDSLRSATAQQGATAASQPTSRRAPTPAARTRTRTKKGPADAHHA